jgi:hypothetical protein
LTTVTLELPLPKLGNVKIRSHWAVGHKERVFYEQLIKTKYRRFIPAVPAKRLCIQYIRYSIREPDFDGLVFSFKHVQDAIVAAGFLADDKMSNTGIPVYSWVKCKTKDAHIIVILQNVLDADLHES